MRVCVYVCVTSLSAALCRDEGKVNNEVQEARIAHEDSVTSVERAQEEYMQAMRERYTAEQLWGDKIRRAATWYVMCTGPRVHTMLGSVQPNSCVHMCVCVGAIPLHAAHFFNSC